MYNSQFTPTTLTFPGDVSTNPDLRYFKQGDVVQEEIYRGGDWGDGKYIDIPATGSNWYGGNRIWENMWSCLTGTPENATSPNVGVTFNADFSSAGGIPTEGPFTISTGVIGEGDCIVNGEDVKTSPNWAYVPNNPFPIRPDGSSVAYNAGHTYTRSAGLEGNRLMTLTGRRTSSSSGLQSQGCWDDNGWLFDEKFFPTAPGPIQVTVISTGYPDSNTMVVDGGEWLGSDNSGEATGDTQVTFGPVTGTGTFQSADLDANTITMSVSNDRWIDNTNRLGTNFYCRDNITVLNADNPKHVAMQQAIAAAFDAFPEKVNERRTSIASSFYRLMEGENPICC